MTAVPKRKSSSDNGVLERLCALLVLTLDIPSDLLPLCREEEIAVTPYSPLGAGFLSGKYTPDRSQFPKGSRFDILPDHADIYFSDENFRTVDRLRAKSAELGIPMVRLAMAWVLSHPDVTSVLIGARTPEHIDNAMAAYEMGLHPELRAELAG